MSYSRKPILTAIIGACAALALPAGASASPVTYHFSGDASSVSTPDFAGALATATGGYGSISGSFTFDNSVADSNSDSSVGVYPGAITSLQFSIGGLTFGADDTAGNRTIEVDDNKLNTGTGNPNDRYLVDMGTTFSTNHSIDGFGNLDTFQIGLHDGDGTTFSGDSFPTLSQINALTAFRGLRLHFSSALESGTVQYTLGQFYAPEGGGSSGVPEPPAMVLLGTGLLGIGFLRRRRQG